MSNKYKLNLSKYSTHGIIINNVGDNKIVLDVGCNDGYIGRVFDSSNVFYGLDNSKESVKKAKHIYEDAIYYDLNNLVKLPWDIKFDLIIFSDVLGHVLYPNKVLRYFVKNYLKRNGLAIISLPNIANWQIRIKLLFGKFEYTDAGILDKTHLHFYTFKTADNLVKEAGLKTIKVYVGSSFLGYVIKYLPFLKELLATGIILINDR